MPWVDARHAPPFIVRQPEVALRIEGRHHLWYALLWHSVMKTLSLSIGMTACALIASTLMAAAPSSQSTAQQPSGAAADDPSAERFSRTCGQCHDAERIIATRRTKSEWQDVLTKMIEAGATGS